MNWYKKYKLASIDPKADTRSRAIREQLNKQLIQELGIEIGDILTYTPENPMSTNTQETRYQVTNILPDGRVSTVCLDSNRKMDIDLWTTNRRGMTVQGWQVLQKHA